MNIDDRLTDRPTTDLRAYSHIWQKFQMAICQRRVIRSTSCMVLGWDTRGRRIERRHFRLNQIKDGGWLPSWTTSNGQIAETYYPIHCSSQAALCPLTLIYNDGDSNLSSQGRVTMV